MMFRLFINDIIRGKMNTVVMLLFIIISALLSCSSVSLLYSSTHQISYFINDMGNVADLNFTMMNTDEQDIDDIHDFMINQNIKDYEIEEDINIPITSMEYVGHKEITSSGCFATTLPKDYNLIFDEDSNIPNIKEGEVGVPLFLKEQLDLTKGDHLKIKRGDTTFTYKISSFLRDSIFGSEMIGQKRFIFHEKDYQKQYLSTAQEHHALLLSIKSNTDREDIEYEMQKANLPNYMAISKDTIYVSYVGVQAGSSAIMLMSGIVLLCLGFLIIRFTILFQIEENYTEIGIMKAIGISHSQIKPLYVTKYLGLTMVGSLVGFTLSIPFCNRIGQMQTGVVPRMELHNGTYLASIVIWVMMIFVYSMTIVVLRRIKRQSAMDAIRKGNVGETYQPHTLLSLSKWKHGSISLYLAISDMFAHRKHTLMMVCMYACSLLLILFPIMLKDTFRDGAFLDVLKLSRGDLYTQQESGVDVEALYEKRNEVEHDLKTFDRSVEIEVETLASAIVNDADVNTSAYLIKRANGNDTIQYNEGKDPILANEVAMSTTLAQKYHKAVGDFITMTIEDKKNSYLITGTYDSMMNMGNNMIAGNDIHYTYATMGYLVINLSGSDAQKQSMIQDIQEHYQGEKLLDTQDMIVAFSGELATQVGAISDLMSIIFLCIVFAISILFAKMQIIKSMQSIAILQGLGFHMKYIRRWQMYRCVLQVGIATVLGIILDICVSPHILQLFFSTIGMGKIPLEIDLWNTVVRYPIVFLSVVLLAQWIVNRTIYKWNVKDLSGE